MNATIIDDCLVAPRDAAKVLAISPRKLWELTRTGNLPHVRIGRSVRYLMADLHAYIARCRVCPAVGAQPDASQPRK